MSEEELVGLLRGLSLEAHWMALCLAAALAESRFGECSVPETMQRAVAELHEAGESFQALATLMEPLGSSTEELPATAMVTRLRLAPRRAHSA